MSAQSPVRYAVTPESSLVIDARSTLHAVRATASGLTGYIAAAWNGDGSLAQEPSPEIHVEFPMDQIRSGNAIQDREMRKLVDASRFPKAAADLRRVEPLGSPNRYKATGDLTLVGRSRAYDGEFTIAKDGESLALDGELALDIRDFGLKPPSLLILKVDPVLRIRLRLVARKAT